MKTVWISDLSILGLRAQARALDYQMWYRGLTLKRVLGYKSGERWYLQVAYEI